MTNENSSPPSLRILILDDEATIRTTLAVCLEAAGHRVTGFGTGAPALEAAAKQAFDLLFLDLRLGIENGLDYIPRFREQSPWIKIIVITAYASIDTAVEAMRRGATDYLPKPFTPEHVEMLAAKVAAARVLEMRLQELEETLDSALPQASLDTDNHTLRESVRLAATFAPSKAAVLIHGETGTGKRTLARAMHYWSPRRNTSFVTCAVDGRDERTLAIELFGAGGGPANTARSRMDLAAGGTLFVEGLHALSARLQSKLLQFIQTGQFEREEGFEQVPADVRIIAASDKPLTQFTQAELFRQDLYYAFSAKTIELPPLRERREDFGALAQSFLAFYAGRNGKSITAFTPEALEYLQSYSWPGNMRELRNVIERAVILARDTVVQIHDLPPNLRAKDSAAVIGDLVPLETIEELHIRGVLTTTNSLDSAARILGIDYATLWRRRKKYGL